MDLNGTRRTRTVNFSDASPMPFQRPWHPRTKSASGLRLPQPLTPEGSAAGLWRASRIVKRSSHLRAAHPAERFLSHRDCGAISYEIKIDKDLLLSAAPLPSLISPVFDLYRSVEDCPVDPHTVFFCHCLDGIPRTSRGNGIRRHLINGLHVILFIDAVFFQ